MRSTRTSFKAAFDYCKDNEEKIRNEKLLDNLKNKKHKEFWRDVQKTKNTNKLLPTFIDNEKEHDKIAANFSKKYKEILDKSQNGISSAESIDLDMSDVSIGEMANKFCASDIKRAIKSLKASIGHDNIHTNHLSNCSDSFIEIIAKLFSACVMHGYTPIDMLRGTINPVVKDKHGNITSSDNYRPVMSSSIFLKLFENCLKVKIGDYCNLNDRQHGFRSKYSTTTACFALKETIFSYVNANSSVYACFIDISKAFDSIDHKILIEKLLDSGISKVYVNLIKFWYCNQRVSVRYGKQMSDEWLLCNGVRQGGGSF